MPPKGPPVIDFGDFLSGDELRMQKCAQEIRKACMKEGFFQIINHTIPISLQKEMIEQSKQFFALPTDAKMKLDKSQNKYNRGYQAMASQMIEAGTKPDLKEGYYVGRELPADHPHVKNEKFGLGPNLWPEELGEHFRKTSMLWLEKNIECANHLLQALALSLGYEKDYFNEASLGVHRDFGAVTILLQDGVPGLEYWDDEYNEWASVQPLEGALVINLGNMFAQWTNDLYRSVIHRVINFTGVERYSFPFNFNGNPDFVIKCLEKTREKPEDEKYAPVTVENFIRPQYASTYGRIGKYDVAPTAGVTVPVTTNVQVTA
ncbi:hypothetical protein BX600DRAFT_483295 [Xylariales sp. PMI_506]|nr:hypothetical protein BX600DRAFT_483295 [Xylariales sp. PMI_506]